MPNTHSKVILLAVPGDEAAGGWPVPFDETVVGDAMTLEMFVSQMYIMYVK